MSTAAPIDPVIQRIPVVLELPATLLAAMTQLRLGKDLSNDQIASACLRHCLALLVESPQGYTAGMTLSDELAARVVEIRQLTTRIEDILLAVEKAASDARVLGRRLTEHTLQ